MTDQTSNQQRADYAAVTLDSSRHYDAFDQVGVQDFLSDLMHFCDGKGWDFTEILRVATDNFNAEVIDEECEGRPA